MDYQYFFDTKDRQNLELYFKLKNKHDFNFSCEEKESFKKEVLELIQPQIKNVELIVVPETGNKLFLEIINDLNKEVHILLKNDKQSIIKCLSEQNMMKEERRKLFDIVENMDAIKMANIPGNQRKRFVDCLFQKIETNKKIMFVDDSVFSGYTFLAAQKAILGNIENNVIIFSKQ